MNDAQVFVLVVLMFGLSYSMYRYGYAQGHTDEIMKQIEEFNERFVFDGKAIVPRSLRQNVTLRKYGDYYQIVDDSNDSR